MTSRETDILSSLFSTVNSGWPLRRGTGGKSGRVTFIEGVVSSPSVRAGTAGLLLEASGGEFCVSSTRGSSPKGNCAWLDR